MSTVTVPFGKTRLFSNVYTRWDDAFFLDFKDGEKVTIKYQKRKDFVKVILISPECVTIVKPIEYNLSFDEWEKFKKEWNFTKS